MEGGPSATFTVVAAAASPSPPFPLHGDSVVQRWRLRLSKVFLI